MKLNDLTTLLGFRLSLLLCFGLCFFATKVQAQTDPDHPNILLIIADDLGVDVFNGYHQNNLMATIPTLDSLRNVGIKFESTWATPQCAPSRAAIMSGKYGINNDVMKAPGNLDTIHTSIFKELSAQTNNLYSGAVIGKWHISQPND
ncbi:MAG: sulfatase-like hydrolase/transferase [Chitinophagales bacterium]